MKKATSKAGAEKLRLLETRIRFANELIRTIATCGRHFFAEGADSRDGVIGRVSCFVLDARGRLGFFDATRGAILPLQRDGWLRRGEHIGGGTLTNLVQALALFADRGRRLPRGLLWHPVWMCDGDIWGYGADMELVRGAAERLDILEIAAPVAAEGSGE